MTQRALVVAWLCSSLGSSIARGEPIEREWPHNGNGSVTVDNTSGSVTIVGWAEPRVRLRGELGARANLEVKRASNSRLQLAVIDAPVARRDSGSQLVLHVPYGVALTVTGVSADVSVSGIRNAPMVAISTISGDQTLAFTAQAARLKSVSGDLSMSGASPRSVVATISGDVELHDFAGGVDVSVVSGDLRIGKASFGVLDVDSVSGDLEIEATPLRDARWKIESLGGDIDLRGIDYDRVAVSADTFSGTIATDSDHGQVEGVDGSHGKRLRLEPPDADARIVVDSFSGDIRLHDAP